MFYRSLATFALFTASVNVVLGVFKLNNAHDWSNDDYENEIVTLDFGHSWNETLLLRATDYSHLRFSLNASLQIAHDCIENNLIKALTITYGTNDCKLAFTWNEGNKDRVRIAEDEEIMMVSRGFTVPVMEKFAMKFYEDIVEILDEHNNKYCVHLQCKLNATSAEKTEDSEDVGEKAWLVNVSMDYALKRPIIGSMRTTAPNLEQSGVEVECREVLSATTPSVENITAATTTTEESLENVTTPENVQLSDLSEWDLPECKLTIRFHIMKSAPSFLLVYVAIIVVVALVIVSVEVAICEVQYTKRKLAASNAVAPAADFSASKRSDIQEQQ